MSRVAPSPASLDDLMKEDGKAELINGRIVRFMASGDLASTVAFEIAARLRDHARQTGVGKAYADGVGYAFDPPLPSGRQSFSPDASFYTGPLPADREDFVAGPPTLAVEVRSKNDYGPAKDREYADKRRDYFFAGTLAVWDVDPRHHTVTLYRASDPLTPVVFRRGDVADAEPAVPGWRVPVADLFA